MIDESKLIFFTGAPGSKWSAVAHLLSFNTKLPINKTDYRDDRRYDHLYAPVAHQGCYWGPGNEYGQDFHCLSSLTKEQIIAEIEAPYTDKNWDEYRIIKCHQFSNHLNFIKHTFPTSKIVIVLRPEIICYLDWLAAGGFQHITYPDYHTYYKNTSNLRMNIIQENNNSKKFIEDNNMESYLITNSHWETFWGIKQDSDEKRVYMESLLIHNPVEITQSVGTWMEPFFKQKFRLLDASLSYYNV